ncbi:MAG TPA: argininosuccinate lyase [Candidatus Acidoferrales bacterium]|nr:argininosuccinate lyase [Candidatus Acidoferrales bacterium]
MSEAGQQKMWGGRFERAPDKAFYEFERSFAFDRRLLPFELQLDRAWARGLEKINILTSGETKQIIAALEQIEKRALAEPAWLDASQAEDVHHFVESTLTQMLGPLGKKLHTGRSRNEMIVTEFRMFIKAAATDMRKAVTVLIKAFVEQAESNFGVAMPGMTHMQLAQPILLSHFLLAHAEAFFHDLDRIAFAANTSDACPLGVGALAGCAFSIDRRGLADDLGFTRITRNSLDSVGRRDFALDYLFALAVLSNHLSRLAEHMILFASPGFGFVILPDEYSTGSSLMPQKKNPDAWELIRGKSGRVAGALTSLLVTMKGLPSSYQRDLQEDKEPLFDAHDQALAMTQIAAGAVSATKFNLANLRRASEDPALIATEAADYLVAKGIPFRQAHEIIGKMVRDADGRGEGYTQWPVVQLKKYSPAFEADFAGALTLEASLARRRVPGGTAPAAVREALAEAKARLGAEEKRA